MRTQWNAREIFSIDPKGDTPFNCVGISKSKPGHPRCLKPIGRPKRNAAADLLNQLSSLPISGPDYNEREVEEIMEELLGEVLCCIHKQGGSHPQNEEVGERWWGRVERVQLSLQRGVEEQVRAQSPLRMVQRERYQIPVAVQEPVVAARKFTPFGRYSIREERIREERIREERIREERIREGRIREERIREERIREERIREERIREKRIQEERIREERIREERIREERIQEERIREERIQEEKRIQEQNTILEVNRIWEEIRVREEERREEARRGEAQRLHQAQLQAQRRAQRRAQDAALQLEQDRQIQVLQQQHEATARLQNTRDIRLRPFGVTRPIAIQSIFQRPAIPEPIAVQSLFQTRPTQRPAITQPITIQSIFQRPAIPQPVATQSLFQPRPIKRPLLRKPLEDCPLCYEPIAHDEDAEWCRAQCGQNVCKGCFGQWLATLARENRKVTCCICRAEWKFEE